MTTFLYTLTGATRKQKEKSVYKSRMLLSKNWVLVFSFMYLVLVDAMDWSYKPQISSIFHFDWVSDGQRAHVLGVK